MRNAVGVSTSVTLELATLEGLPAESAVLHPGHVNDSLVKDVANHVRKLSHWLRRVRPNAVAVASG